MILLIDAGNTRVKWRQWDGQRLGGGGAAPRNGPWLAGLEAELRGAVERVVLCNVGGEELEAQLRERVRRPIQRIASAVQADGVRNGYDDAGSLGTDRWAAIVGAHALHPGVTLLIVDAGTALTVDLVAVDGSHDGGWIAPGLRMAETALLGGAHGIGAPAAFHGGLGPGRSTRAAVASGIVEGALGLIARGRDYARRQGMGEPRVLLTGGDGIYLQVTGELAEAEFEPDLVFHGLARLATASAREEER